MKRIREEEKRITQRNKRKKLDILFLERNTQKIYSLIEKSIALSKKDIRIEELKKHKLA